MEGLKTKILKREKKGKIIMDIVKINLYAEAYYSGAVYEEDLVVSKDLYDKIKDDLDKYDYDKYGDKAEEIYVGELDGKHSEVGGCVSFEKFSESETENENWDLKGDGEQLYYTIEEICEGKNIDLESDVKDVKEYLKNIDSIVTISIMTKKSNVEKIRKFAKSIE